MSPDQLSATFAALAEFAERDGKTRLTMRIMSRRNICQALMPRPCA
jgi:hypothetical protein